MRTATAPSSNSYSTDRTKQLERLEKDSNGDGNPDQWQTYDQGNLARIALDQDFNGQPEQWQSFQPSGAMSLIEIDTHRKRQRRPVAPLQRTPGSGRWTLTPTADGKADQIIHYDGEGNITRVLAEPRCGGQAARLDGVQ